MYRFSFPAERPFVCSQGELSPGAAHDATQSFVTSAYASLVRTSPSEYALDIGGRSFTGTKESDRYVFTEKRVLRPSSSTTYTVETSLELQTNGESAFGTVDVDVASSCEGGCLGFFSARCRQSISFSGVEVETAL